MSDAPYQRGSETSLAAAQAIEPRLHRDEEIVLRVIRARDGFGITDDELEVHFTGNGWAAPTARARRIALVRKGLVADSGKTRPTRTGRQATVWIAVEPPQDTLF